MILNARRIVTISVTSMKRDLELAEILTIIHRFPKLKCKFDMSNWFSLESKKVYDKIKAFPQPVIAEVA